MLLRSGAREIVDPLRGVRRGSGVGRACSRGARRTESGPGEIGRGDDDDEEEEFLHRGSWWHAGRGHGDPATPSKARLAFRLGRDEAAPAVVGTAMGAFECCVDHRKETADVRCDADLASRLADLRGPLRRAPATSRRRPCMLITAVAGYIQASNGVIHAIDHATAAPRRWSARPSRSRSRP